MEWNALTLPFASALLGAAIAVGITRQKIERLVSDVENNSKILHTLGNKLQSMELNNALAVSKLQNEMHEGYVTFRLFEAHLTEFREVKSDIKQLLEMVAVMNARQENKNA